MFSIYTAQVCWSSRLRHCSVCPARNSHARDSCCLPVHCSLSACRLLRASTSVQAGTCWRHQRLLTCGGALAPRAGLCIHDDANSQLRLPARGMGNARMEGENGPDRLAPACLRTTHARAGGAAAFGRVGHQAARSVCFEGGALFAAGLDPNAERRGR